MRLRGLLNARIEPPRVPREGAFGSVGRAQRVLGLTAGWPTRTVVAVSLAVTAAVALSASSASGQAVAEAPTITSAVSLTVDEGTTAVATFAATDGDTDPADLVWSLAGGADVGEFSLDAASGELRFAAAKDFESPDDADGDGVYAVRVQVSDGDNDVAADVSVTVANVIELEAVEGPASVTFEENSHSRVASFTASSEEDRDGIAWTLGGADADHFRIDEPPGVLRFDLDAVSPSIWSKPPDFEAPVDNGGDNTYTVTLTPAAGTDVAAAAFTVTVTVADADEPGTVTLSSKRPHTGTALTAALSDPDGVTADTESWVWERSTGYKQWAEISGADSADYTPTAADAGSFLRVTVTYTDSSTGNAQAQAQAVAPEVVAADRLSALTISTNDSVASSGSDDWRLMRPAFEAATLHYSIGCDSADTMTLTMRPANGSSRISVDGVQYANPGATGTLTAAVPVSGNSTVRVSLADAQGAQTQYTVHCLDDDFPEINVEQPLGDTGLLDELILLTTTQRLAAVDHHGVPRFSRSYQFADGETRGRGGRFFRFYPDQHSGQPRYSIISSGLTHILDEDLDEIAVARTVAPLTRQDAHDFRLLPDGSYMLMAYQDAERDMSHLTFNANNGEPYGSDVYVEDSAIQIVTPDGRGVFNWNSWDHIPLEDCTQHFFIPSNGDWAHLNTIQWIDGRIIASIRGCSRVLAIDATTGDVVWRIGPTNLSDTEWEARDVGPAPLDVIGDPEKQFCGQHGSSLRPSGNLILYDNGVQCTRNPWTRQNLLRENNVYSRGLEYALDLDSGEAIFVRDHSLFGAKSELGYRNGHIEELSNGHWLIAWGGARPRNPPKPSPAKSVTQADPDTGQEWLHFDGDGEITRATVMRPEALARSAASLTAEFPDSARTSVLHSGAGDAPEVVVAFNRPVADFAASTPSVSVQGATVTSVAPHLVAGEPANAYLIALAPTGAGPISVRLVAGEACDSGGICTADGSVLETVPSPLVIGPPIEVSFGAAVYSVSEGAVLELPVVLDSAHTRLRDVEIPVVVSGGSASGDEYTVRSVVSFAAGETRKPATIDAADDDLVEGPETVELSLGTLPVGFSEGTRSTATITIADADSAAMRAGFASSEVSEGGEVDLTARITNGVTFAADQTVNLALSGTATAGDDYLLLDSANATLSAPHQVTLAAGASSVTLTLRALDDSDTELAETVSLSATLASTGALIGSDTVTIGPSDLTAPEVSIAAGGAVAEGADAQFTLSRTETAGIPLSEPLTVRVSVTATAGVGLGAAPSAVTFDAGAGTAELRAATENDAVVEHAGAVTVLVLAAVGNPPPYVVGSSNRAQVEVRDDDTVSFSVTAEASAVAEGGTAAVTVRTGGVTFAQPQTLEVELSGTATAADDFVLLDAGDLELPAPYDLTLAAGASSVELRVSAVDDGMDDDGEAVTVTVRHEGAAIGSATIIVNDINEAPTLEGRPALRYAENDTAVAGAFTATDPEGDLVTWDLSGPDQALFTIAGGELSFGSPPDFEAPADADGDNVYGLVVEASAVGGTVRRDVTVTVTDVDESATITIDSGSLTVPYVEDATAAVASFSAEDPESAPIRWSLGGDDGEVFEISNRGVLRFLRPPDYERPVDDGGDNEYLVQVLARAGASDPVTLGIAVDVINSDEPAVVRLSSPQPQVGAAMTAVLDDPDGAVTLSWTWQRSLNGGPWADVGTASGYTPQPADEGYDLRAQASYVDSFDGSTDNAAAQAPHATRPAPSSNSAPDFGTGLLRRTVDEGADAGASVGAAVAAVDHDVGDRAKLSYTLSGADAELFGIDRTTGQIRVGSGTVLDFETAPTAYSVTVTAADPSGTSGAVPVTIELNDINEAPVATHDSAATVEDTSVGVAVLANDADPEDDSLSVRLGDAPLHGSATVLSDNTILYTPRRDFNGRDIFTYLASDGRLAREAVVIVTVAPVNDQPKFPTRSVTRSAPDGAPPGTLVGPPVEATDADGEPLSYELFEEDAPFFDIDPDTGQIRVGADTVIDRSAKSSYRLRVEATDPNDARVSTAVIVTAGTTSGSFRASSSSGGSDGGGSGSGGSGSGGGDLDAGVAVLVAANGRSAADVGVASVLAARTPGAVVVYTGGGALPDPTRELIGDALPAEVIIIGGTAAVSHEVRGHIRAVSPGSDVVRVTGADRIDTAANTARHALGPPSGAGPVTMVVANGWSPPDIGVAAALAARTPRSAVLYVGADELGAASLSLLRDYEVTRVVIVGGTTAVSAAVEARIGAAAAGASVSRLAGTDRVDTASLAARRVLGGPADAAAGITLVIASGWSPPDIGVAAALAAKTPNAAVAYSPTSTLPAATAALIADYRLERIIIIGGRAAITDSVRDAIAAAAPDTVIRRISGATREHTAAAAARSILRGN
ncbi:cadherin domain-containing protein [Candidatus Poriferisodalis sp.]|uniref:cadherin domain-containing protein n=1 Tax=Candidatus Poriferisodalis sp. TaxID=3101277 RepID=UPI003B0268C3